MYICSSCQYASTTKLGKCHDCGDFGSFVADNSKPARKTKATKKHQLQQGNQLATPKVATSKSYPLHNSELMRVLPSGIKQWWLYLLGGEPGIGKSTLVLQIVSDLTTQTPDIRIAYFSGEETAQQITERQTRISDTNTLEASSPPDKGGAQRAGGSDQNIDIYHTTHLEDIVTTTDAGSYDMIIVDSIQTVYSASIDGIAGSPSQVKQCSEKLSEFCKGSNTSCLVIWHVTKGGEIAGPKYLEHIVDVVLYLEGDRFGQYRFLRSRKNRYGPTDEVGIFEMWLFWLQPVYDLKDRIVEQANISTPGNVLTVGIDNGRPVLINLEVLLNKTYGKYPQRVAQGIDPKRLQIICAVLDRYLKLHLGNFDIYVNIPGEFTFRDNGLDLALAAAIYSQAKDKVIDKELVFIGELGLGGQVLTSKLHKKRTAEVKDFSLIDGDRMKYISELPKIL